MYNHMGDT